jgi:hypothetical protein
MKWVNFPEYADCRRSSDRLVVANGYSKYNRIAGVILEYARLMYVIIDCVYWTRTVELFTVLHKEEYLYLSSCRHERQFTRSHEITTPGMYALVTHLAIYHWL